MSVNTYAGMTLYAHWGIIPHYAVCVWGIEHDVDFDGNVMGITFGSAWGFDGGGYYERDKEFVSHDPSGLTLSGNVHRCVHDDLWSVISEWNLKKILMCMSSVFQLDVRRLFL